MSEQPEDDLNPLADALRQLRPQPVELDRAALMYRAGQESARYSWAWPLLSAALLLLSLGLGAALFMKPAPQGVVEVGTVRIRIVPESVPPTPRREEPETEPAIAPAEVADVRSELPRASCLRLLRQVEKDGDLKPAPAAFSPSSAKPDNALDLGGETLKEPWLLRRLALQTGGSS